MPCKSGCTRAGRPWLPRRQTLRSKAGALATGRLTKNTLKKTRAMVDNAEYYMKTMERVLERGSKYPRQERDRIKGMLQKGGTGFSIDVRAGSDPVTRLQR